MRHSDIGLTMNTYTDAGLLDTAEAVEALPIARDDANRELAPMLAPMLAPKQVQASQIESIPVHSDDAERGAPETTKPRETQGLAGFDSVGATRFELASTSRTESRI